MTISWTDSEIYYYDSWRMWIDAFLSTLSTSSTSSFSSSSFSENRYLSEEKWNPATNTTSMMDDPMTNGWMDPDWTFPPTSDPDGYFNINQHNNHDDHHNNGSGVGPTSITQHHRESREQILGYLLWYLFLVVCCVLPTCCAYRRRRLMGERLVQQQQANLDRLRQQNHQQQNFFVINLPYDETTTSSANVNNNNNNDQTETITEILKGTTFTVKASDIIKTDDRDSIPVDDEELGVIMDMDATDNTLLKLPNSNNDENNNNNTNEACRTVSGVCAICLSTYEEGDRVTWSPGSSCPHAFHTDCIVAWLAKKYTPHCPCCRQEFCTLPPIPPQQHPRQHHQISIMTPFGLIPTTLTSSALSHLEGGSGGAGTTGVVLPGSIASARWDALFGISTLGTTTESAITNAAAVRARTSANLSSLNGSRTFPTFVNGNYVTFATTSRTSSAVPDPSHGNDPVIPPIQDADATTSMNAMAAGVSTSDTPIARTTTSTMSYSVRSDDDDDDDNDDLVRIDPVVEPLPSQERSAQGVRHDNDDEDDEEIADDIEMGNLAGESSTSSPDESGVVSTSTTTATEIDIGRSNGGEEDM